MQNIISTNNESADPNAEIKTRLANLLINRVTLSECLNVIRDACVQRASDIIDKASEKDMQLILQDLEEFENPSQQSEATGPEATGPEATGPEVTGPEVTGPEVTGPEVTGPEVTGPEVTGPQTTAGATYSSDPQGEGGNLGSNGMQGQPDITLINESGPMA